MIRLPNDRVVQHLRERLHRGAVIYFHVGSYDRDKYGVVLNAQWPEDEALLAIATSQVTWFEKHPEWDDHILRISPGAYPFFTKNTIVDLRQVVPVAVAEWAETQDFEIVSPPPLSENDLADIDQKIRTSRTLTGRMIKRLIR